MNEIKSKQEWLISIIATLQDDWEGLSHAAQEAHINSTSAESRQEGKYDTRGIEAAYLAGAQAEQVVIMQHKIQILSTLTLAEDMSEEAITVGHMILVDNDGEDIGFFMLPAGGGIEFEHQGIPFSVITPESPVGQELLGKKAGATVDLPFSHEAFIVDLW